jgi:hypothetical protein
MPYADPAHYDLPFASGSDTSEAAALRAKRFCGPQGLEVLAWFVARNGWGGTQRECATALHIGRPSICARVHALEKAGSLRKTALRRGGCAIYEAV